MTNPIWDQYKQGRKVSRKVSRKEDYVEILKSYSTEKKKKYQAIKRDMKLDVLKERPSVVSDFSKVFKDLKLSFKFLVDL